MSLLYYNILLTLRKLSYLCSGASLRANISSGDDDLLSGDSLNNISVSEYSQISLKYLYVVTANINNHHESSATCRSISTIAND
jgi:hypothetical protein